MITSPTDAKTFATRSKSSWVALLPPAIAVTPSPTPAGVFDIIRTAAIERGSNDCMVSVVTPAATLTTTAS